MAKTARPTVASRRDSPGFGIDFGTTNSVAAVTAKDQAPFPLLEDGKPHPSVVWFSLDGVIVGAQARQNINSQAGFQGNKFIRSIKADLGYGRNVDVGGEMRPAWMVASEIFRHIREQAYEGHGWSIGEAVVTVPVNFDGLQRAEIRRAAEHVGVQITRFVHEPFAAVVGYYRGLGANMAALPPQTILVFDWGGGTLDITLVRCDDGRLEELATGGLPKIAGDRFDKYVEGYARDKFIQRTGISPDAYLPSNATRDHIAMEAERAKIELSDRMSSVIRVASVLEREAAILDLREEMTRTSFEDMIVGDIDAAMQQVSRMLEEARLASSEVDKVLLVGGTSEIPLLRRRMAEVFGIRAQPVHNSQTVIAEGASVIAHEGYEPYLASAVQVELSDKSLHTVFGRETRVPQVEARSLTLFCTDNRDGEARLLIRQGLGSRDGHSNKLQEIFAIPVEPALPPAYQYERVYANFSIDEDLILRVEARGAARNEVRATGIHDLRFGLRLR